MSQGKPKNRSHWNPSHPGEVARDRLRKEVKAGRISKPDQCQLCPNRGNLIGHHYRGYAYPLDVWWLCNSCNTVKQLKHDGSQTLEEAKQLMSTVAHKKIDNSALEAKLDLRRMLLDKYHGEGKLPINVLDCCRGSGVLWQTLREEYQVTSYWGVDFKRKTGYMAVDSRRLLKTPGWPQNVIDVDTYGSPWEHWLALIRNVTKPTTVFLTVGDSMGTAMQPVASGSHLLGFPPSTPTCLQAKMGHSIAPRILLTRCTQFCTILAEATEAISEGAHARYIACHLIPKNQTPEQACH